MTYKKKADRTGEDDSPSAVGGSTSLHVVKLWSSGGQTYVHDWLMSDGSIKTMTCAEAREYRQCELIAKNQIKQTKRQLTLEKKNKNRDWKVDFLKKRLASWEGMLDLIEKQT